MFAVLAIITLLGVQSDPIVLERPDKFETMDACVKWLQSDESMPEKLYIVDWADHQFGPQATGSGRDRPYQLVFNCSEEKQP